MAEFGASARRPESLQQEVIFNCGLNLFNSVFVLTLTFEIEHSTSISSGILRPRTMRRKKRGLP
jgi:hypothetical protein